MDNDDIPVGRILSRREILALFGATGAAIVAAACSGSDSRTSPNTATPTPNGTTTTATTVARATESAAATTTASTTSTVAATATAMPACVVSAELTEGPYFVDEKLNRSDIRADSESGEVKEGTPLEIDFQVMSVTGNSCGVLPNADVDIWHCDALGVYSDASDPGFNTKGQDWLRGYQTTDATGIARFTTIYPGWYQGRAVHVHFKVRGTTTSGKRYEFTSQLFFDEAQTDVVHALAPYASKGYRTLKNEGDGIYRQSGGTTLLPVTKSGDGYAGTFSIGIQQS